MYQKTKTWHSDERVVVHNLNKTLHEIKDVRLYDFVKFNFNDELIYGIVQGIVQLESSVVILVHTRSGVCEMDMNFIEKASTHKNMAEFKYLLKIFRKKQALSA